MSVMSVEYAQKRIKELTQQSEIRGLDPRSIADLGGCYFTLGMVPESLVLVKRASEMRKDAGILMNLGLIYKDLGQHKESLRSIEEAFLLNPDDNYIRLGYSEALLRAGFWNQAWPLYDHARPTQIGAHDDLRLPAEVREWKYGEALPSQSRVLVINEGGTGDRISYARWLSELTKRGIDWVFYPYSELFSFFERIFPRERLLKDGDPVVATHWTTTFSLPAVLNIGPTDIPEPLLLSALPEKIAKYRFSSTDDLPVLGICYQAAELFQGGRRVRSMSEGQAMRLIMSTADKVHWISLQHGVKMPYPVLNLGIETWEDTAGLIHNLDGVVTVDTGVMHLAGALGKPMATVLSGNSCWKFGATGERCRLYPTAKLFRNETEGFENSVSLVVAAIRSGFFTHNSSVPA